MGIIMPSKPLKPAGINRDQIKAFLSTVFVKIKEQSSMVSTQLNELEQKPKLSLMQEAREQIVPV